MFVQILFICLQAQIILAVDVDCKWQALANDPQYKELRIVSLGMLYMWISFSVLATCYMCFDALKQIGFQLKCNCKRQTISPILSIHDTPNGGECIMRILRCRCLRRDKNTQDNDYSDMETDTHADTDRDSKSVFRV